MGVKRTIRVTRSEAEKRYAVAHARSKRKEIETDVAKRLPDLCTSDLPWNWDDLGLTNEHMVSIYALGAVRLRMDDEERAGRHLAIDLDDASLERDLQRVNDLANDGEGFESYDIVPEERSDD
jgi:hypothetical protein